jgi:hypothetical protein
MRGKRAAEIAGYVETCGVTGLDIPDGDATPVWVCAYLPSRFAKAVMVAMAISGLSP